MVRDRAGRAARHRILERPQAPLCLGAPTAPSRATSSRYRSNAESRIDLADAPLSPDLRYPRRSGELRCQRRSKNASVSRTVLIFLKDPVDDAGAAVELADQEAGGHRL